MAERMADPQSIATIRACYEQIRAAQQALWAAIIEELPVGALCAYGHGELEVQVQVIAHTSSGGRLKVRGRTGREYWMDAARITGRVD